MNYVYTDFMSMYNEIMALPHWPEQNEAAAIAAEGDYRIRRAAQRLIEIIGAPGPETLEETVERAIKRIQELES